MVPHITFNKIQDMFIVSMMENASMTSLDTSIVSQEPAPKKKLGNLRFKKAIFKTMENNEEQKAESYEKGLTKGYANVDSIDGKYRFKIGVIDFLTEFDVFKLLENKTKSRLGGVSSLSISAIDQVRYQKRFIKFMEENI